MLPREGARRDVIKTLKRPFKKVVFHFKHGLSSLMSGSGEWLIYMAQRFSPYKFRAYQPMPWIGLKTRKRDQIDRWYRGCDPLLEKNLAKRQGLFEVRRLRAVPVHPGSSVYFWW